MKKKLAVISAVAVLCFATLVTFAFFSAQKTTTNVISTGTVDLELYETDGQKEYWGENGMTITGVMPDTDVTKNVFIYNKGSADLYARVRATVTVTGADGKTLSPQYVSYAPDSKNWTEKNGWYYYNGTMKPGNKTSAALFISSVHIDKNMPNEYQGCTIRVKVEAQAVQSKNNGSSALNAAGWPAE